MHDGRKDSNKSNLTRTVTTIPLLSPCALSIWHSSTTVPVTGCGTQGHDLWQGELVAGVGWQRPLACLEPCYAWPANARLRPAGLAPYRLHDRILWSDLCLMWYAK